MKTLNQIGGPLWTPKSTLIGASQRREPFDITTLFSANEQGVYLNALDSSTMFADSAGQSHVLNGQTIALMLDRSKNLTLGSEMITGGNFESTLVGTKADSAGSVSTYELNSISPISGAQDAKLIITTAGANRPLIQFPSLFQRIGQAFELSFDYKVTQGEPCLVGINIGSMLVRVDKFLVGEGRFKAHYVRDSATNPDRSYLYFGINTGALQIDNVSLKPISGNAVSQTSASNRPLLIDGQVIFDTVDDQFSLQPQSLPLVNCTVITASKEQGLKIQTGKTFSTSIIINQNFCQYLLINRSLTAIEQQQIINDFEEKLRMI